MLLTACGGLSVTQSSQLQDAENQINTGLQAYSEAKWNNARLLFTRALLLYQGIDDQQGVLYCHINLAEVALATGEYTAVKRQLDLAADIAKADTFQHYQKRIKLLYAQNALRQQQIAVAEIMLQPLLPAFNGVTAATAPDIIQLIAIVNRTKIAFLRQQKEELWVQRYAAALKLSAMKNPELEARLLRFQAILLQRQGDNRAAESNLLQALSEYKKNFSRAGIAATLSALGQHYMAQSLWQDSKDYLKRSIAVFRYLKNSDKANQLIEKLVKVESELSKLDREVIN